MRIADHKWSKQQEWEREKHYQEHMTRMRSIASQKRLRNKEGHQQGPSLPSLRSLQKSEKQREIELQNERIMKKLNQIGTRKSQLAKQTKEQKNYYTINMKSREMNRKQRFSHIQQENDQMVERILRKRSISKGLLHDLSIDSNSGSIRNSRKRRRNVSLILPSIPQQPSLPQFGSSHDIE